MLKAESTLVDGSEGRPNGMSLYRSAVQRTDAQHRDLAPGWPINVRTSFGSFPSYAPRQPGPGGRDATSAAYPKHRRFELWTQLVGGTDAVLRRYHHIKEFTDDPDCIFRLGLSRARNPVRLHDGTPAAIDIRPGEPIGTLHLWNEHLLRYVSGGPDIHWAAAIGRRVEHSLRLLAIHVERDADCRGLRAFQGAAMLSSRLGALQINRVAGRFGFELIDTECSLAGRLHRLADSFCGWSLTSAFNPAALARQRFFRPYHELWITRAALIDGHRPQRHRGSRDYSETG